MKTVERIVETILWNSRFVTLIAVVASLAGSLALLFVAIVDARALLGELIAYANGTFNALEHGEVRLQIVTSVAAIVDGLLFALVLLIFAFGIYELFISKINVAETNPIAERLLLIRSLDDLKERLAKVILLILIVRYFELAVHRPVETALDLLFLAVGIALIAIALYFTSAKPKGDATNVVPSKTSARDATDG